MSSKFVSKKSSKKGKAPNMAYQMGKAIASSMGRQALPLVKGKERVGGFYGRYNLPNGGSENKFFDTALSFTPATAMAVPASGQLCLIPQGVTESTRVGRKAVIKSIQLRGKWVYIPATSTAGVANTFVYVVLDKQCNGAAAACTDVLTSTSAFSAMINLANSERFVILKRILIHNQSEAGVQTALSADSDIFDWYHKCNIPMEFSSTTGAITEIKSNNIFLLAGTDAVESALCVVTGTCRLRFSDE